VAYFQIKTSRSASTCRRCLYRARSLRPALAAALILAALAAVAPASAGAAPALAPCRGQEEFGCATIGVPLDRTGATPGTVPLHYAIQRRGPRKVLIALSGGPGQSAVSSASSFAISLDPALRRYRLAVLDQRGTGKSGVLSCPNLQRLRSLDAYTPQAVLNCANRIGPKRAFYTTADTVLDIDALRQALGADKIALMGISYGTHVALQYARAFPDHVDRLILDSIVGPDGPDAFLLDTYRNMPRVLAEQCAHGACRNATRDPVADVGALVRRINASGPLRGDYYDATGRKRATQYATPDELSFLVIAGDLNPFLQAALPAAISAARRGDYAPLMRVRRIGQGGRTRQEDLSVGLNATTGCTDVTLPFPRSAPVADRSAIAQQALAAIPPTDYEPWDPQTVLRTSYVDDCLAWPNDATRAPFTGPLPDVPALLLGGRLDTRTPLENARATALELPHSTIVALKGSGHDALDSDITGCTAEALSRFIEDVSIGHPCLNQDNGVRPMPLPPRSLSDFRSAPGVGGDRGRAVFAVLDTVTDARLAALQTLFAGLEVQGGGLRGGSFSGQASFEGRLRLRRYSFVPGLRVTGSLSTSEGTISGTVRVSGTAHGTLRISRRGTVTGTLGGRHVRYRPRRGAVSATLRDGGSLWPRTFAPRRLPVVSDQPR
jgi:pimeloyl-ACP methyl ester carboxylesterase